jgi:hypothetical protein
MSGESDQYDDHVNSEDSANSPESATPPVRRRSLMGPQFPATGAPRAQINFLPPPRIIFCYLNPVTFCTELCTAIFVLHKGFARIGG